MNILGKITVLANASQILSFSLHAVAHNCRLSHHSVTSHAFITIADQIFDFHEKKGERNKGFVNLFAGLSSQCLNDVGLWHFNFGKRVWSCLGVCPLLREIDQSGHTNCEDGATQRQRQKRHKNRYEIMQS